MCGWQVKLCDPLVTHRSYLSALEMHTKCLLLTYIITQTVSQSIIQYIQDHSESTYLQQGPSSLDPQSISGRFPKFNGEFLVKRYVYDNISMKIQSLFPDT